MATPQAPSASLANPPQNPAGPNPGPFGETFPMADISLCTEAMATAPSRLRDAVRGLAPAQLDTKYRNWTVRQIAYHLGETHCNAYVRWKLALTENVPTIKPMDESAWAAMAHTKTGDLESALMLFEGIQRVWVGLIRSLGPEDLRRQFFHPELKGPVRLVDSLRTYAWHTDHHIGQIEWMRKGHGW